MNVTYSLFFRIFFISNYVYKFLILPIDIVFVLFLNDFFVYFYRKLFLRLFYYAFYLFFYFFSYY